MSLSRFNFLVQNILIIYKYAGPLRVSIGISWMISMYFWGTDSPSYW